MTAAPVLTRKTFSNCAHYKPRDPAAPWPRAGVPRSAGGQCLAPRLEVRGEWRNASDWCDRHKRETAAGPSAPRNVG